MGRLLRPCQGLPDTARSKGAPAHPCTLVHLSACGFPAAHWLASFINYRHHLRRWPEKELLSLQFCLAFSDTTPYHCTAPAGHPVLEMHVVASIRLDKHAGYGCYEISLQGTGLHGLQSMCCAGIKTGQTRRDQSPTCCFVPCRLADWAVDARSSSRSWTGSVGPVCALYEGASC